MVTLNVDPGEGVQLDFQVEDAENPEIGYLDISAWTVTATLHHRDGTVVTEMTGDPPAATPLALEITSGGSFLWRVHMTGTQSAAFAGKQMVIRVVGKAPTGDEPIIEKALLRFASF
jgi:hypothetical protein